MPVLHQDPVLLPHHGDNGSQPFDKVAVTTPVPCSVPGVLSGPSSFQRVFNSWGSCASSIHTDSANGGTMEGWGVV
ncbi:hypothetical protein PBY51_003326 [Eleginops maclovinus]|uniref:Uncharacterized protein n=1 Tax=Eleginops maclovinus TaxID=56733 RepID=A0AAN7XEG1_ELEMC|nr:hypothetical protein PBY51_003326 [Eleginops maclovinus]